jgi:hypothetical protein
VGENFIRIQEAKVIIAIFCKNGLGMHGDRESQSSFFADPRLSATIEENNHLFRCKNR